MFLSFSSLLKGFYRRVFPYLNRCLLFTVQIVKSLEADLWFVILGCINNSWLDLQDGAEKLPVENSDTVEWDCISIIAGGSCQIFVWTSGMKMYAFFCIYDLPPQKTKWKNKQQQLKQIQSYTHVCIQCINSCTWWVNTGKQCYIEKMQQRHMDQLVFRLSTRS